MGGAAVLTLLLGLIKAKFAAVLIGAAGLGVLAALTAIHGLLGTLFGLGLQSSAVRDVATAAATNQAAAVAATASVLKKVCWLTGTIGLGFTIVFSSTISRMTFDTSDYALEVALLGLMLLFGNLAAARLALLQGLRRISDLAKTNVLAALVSTAISVLAFAWLGVEGVIIALIAGAFIQFVFASHYERRLAIETVSLRWGQVASQARTMVELGAVLMWSTLLVSAVTLFTVSHLTYRLGLESVGHFSAAFALSGAFVNFVLAAMAADYYPRLVGATGSQVEVNRLVNEQTEIGILLVLPGMLAAMLLAPILIWLFYSSEFMPAVDSLRWFVLGCFIRVVSWPLSFVILAFGRKKIFFMVETGANLLHVALIVIGVANFGLAGVSVAFFAMYVIYGLTLFGIVSRLTGFVWSAGARKIGSLSLAAIGIVALITMVLSPPFWALALLGFLVCLLATVGSIRGLIRRLGDNHRLSQAIRGSSLARRLFMLGDRSDASV